jgi:hypothetical protein
MIRLSPTKRERKKRTKIKEETRMGKKAKDRKATEKEENIGNM